MMLWGLNGNWGGWAFWLHLLFSWLVPLAIIILLVYLALIWGKDRKSSSGHGDLTNPLDILKQRYARGEITSEEYQRIKEEIKQD